MGMFDYIECEHPLPDGFAESCEWQTKDLECEMTRYRITADGRLEQRSGGWSDVNGFTGPKTLDDFHGDLEFYSSNWIGVGYGFVTTRDEKPFWSRTYIARFTGGRLEKITGGLDQSENAQWLPRSDYDRITGAIASRVRELRGDGPFSLEAHEKHVEQAREEVLAKEQP